IVGLVIGVEHFEASRSLVRTYPNLELIITDADSARLDEARLASADDYPTIRFINWDALERVSRKSLDFCASIDSLSEIAVLPDGLSAILRVLRPRAPIIAGELCPSLFWDIARGSRATWWRRSASVEFPVGTLLTAQEWVEELEAAGFAAVRTEQAHS